MAHKASSTGRGKPQVRILQFPVLVTLRHKLADQKTRKSLDRGEFRLLHYAGEVTYSVTGEDPNAGSRGARRGHSLTFPLFTPSRVSG